MAKLTNKEVLTRGQKYFDKKKASKQVDQVTFNANDRLEYLTGFHKRKVQRQKTAAQFKEQQALKERQEERLRIREERKQMVRERLEALKKEQEKMQDIGEDDDDEEGKRETKRAKKNDKKVQILEDREQRSAESEEEDEDGEEWRGFDSEDNENTTKGILKKKLVFSNSKKPDTASEDTITDNVDVTIESLTTNDGISNGLGGIDLFQVAKLNNVELDKSDEVLEKAVDRAKKYAVLAGFEKPMPKKKKRKFRYLSKGERRENTRKERSKRFKKTE